MIASRNLTSWSSVALVGTLLVSSTAFASGFAVARFGGGHGNPVSVSPASIYYNPGAMAFNEGTNIYLDYTLAWRKANYDRVIGDPSEWNLPDGITADSLGEAGQQIHRQTNEGEGTLDNLIGSPMIGFTTDFGGTNIVLGAGFYVPFGGSAVWGEQNLDEPAATQAPFAADGPQRWFTIDGSIRVLTLALGVGARTDDGRFGVGLTTNLNITQVDTIRARNAAGDDQVLTSRGGVAEGRAVVEADGFDASVGVGLRWEAIEDRFIVSASWQSAPNITGHQEIEGELTTSLAGGDAGTDEIYFVQQLPQTFRWGFGYRFMEDPALPDSDVKAEVRLTGDVITWGNFKHQCLVKKSEVEGRLEAREACDFNANGSLTEPNFNGAGAGSPVRQNVPRGWHTGFGVKLGASNYLSDMFELYYSVGFDSSAVPDETLDPVLMDMPKIAIDAGFVVGVTDWLDVSLLVANVFYFKRENTESTLFASEAPSRQPDANGTYTQNILIGNLGLNFHF